MNFSGSFVNQSLKIKSGLRIALAVGFIASALTWIATWMGIVPNPADMRAKQRVTTTRTIAASISGQLGNGNKLSLGNAVESATILNEDVASIEILRLGKRWVSHGVDEIEAAGDEEQLNDVVELELLSNGSRWGDLKIQFATVTGAGTLASWAVLSRSFKYLNPSRVVPKRVRSAFDTLAEGLVLVNKDIEIAHANVAFEEIIEIPLDKIIGRQLSAFGWSDVEGGSDTRMPWQECLEEGRSLTGRILEFESDASVRRFMVNTAPVYGENGQCRGAMVSFDDITEMERKNAELRRSRDEVKRQNQRLSFLASYDPLTKCMNRRAFWSEYEKLWEECELEELSLLMIDIDHFKSINDTYGHSFGDAVLAQMGEELRKNMGERGVVCRYGGEEFCVAIPNVDLETAISYGNDLIETIRAMDIDGKKITASLGLANRKYKAMDCQHLLDQADQCLYVAKREGRDQQVVFNESTASEAILKPESDGSAVEEFQKFGEIQPITQCVSQKWLYASEKYF